jgi:predicted MPP superfamily phosphohydrolase
MSAGISLMIMVLSAFVAVLFGCHFFVYFSLVKFLGIATVNTKIWLGSILFILGISFFVSSALAHYTENAITKTFYFFSGLWLGFGLNLILAFIVSWIIIGIAKFFGIQFDYKYLVMAAVVFATVFSSYGVWNVYHPQVKNITVKIKNLPESWRGKTAVQLSDVHLGLVLGADFLANIVQKVNVIKPDIVFITGDLFDGMDGNLSALVDPLNNLKPADGAYFVTGNHETYLGVSTAFEALKSTPVKILKDELVDVSGMQILGISYPERGENRNVENVIANIKNFDAKKPSILLYHNPAEAQHAQASGVNLQLAGHTHVGQLFPFQFITQLVYGKYFYGLNIDGDFSIYTSSGIGTWGPTMRTSSNPEIVVIHFE